MLLIIAPPPRQETNESIFVSSLFFIVFLTLTAVGKGMNIENVFMNSKQDTSGSNRNLTSVYCETPEQRVLNLATVGVPEVPELGMSRFRHNIVPVREHGHGDCIEIGLCLRGDLTLLNNKVEYRVMPGDIFLNRPEVLHCLKANPHGTLLNSLLLHPPRKGRSFLCLKSREARDIWSRLNRLPCHVVGKTDAVKQAFAHLFKFYDQSPSPYRTVCLNTACVSLLIGVIEAASHKAVVTHSRRIDQIVSSLRENPERKVSIDNLAHEAGMSPSLFNREFKHITGLPACHFQISCRLEKAKRLLASTDTPITRLAFDLGFCASHHFSSHFKRTYGITPHAWRKQNRKPG